MFVHCAMFSVCDTKAIPDSGEEHSHCGYVFGKLFITSRRETQQARSRSQVKLVDNSIDQENHE